MRTINLTAKDFKKSDSYWSDYIGEIDFSQEVDANIEIDADLGYVKFAASLRVKGYIYAKAGTGIDAGWGIEAGEGIKAGLSIFCKRALSWQHNLFAGTATWKRAEGAEKRITCGSTPGEGVVAYGDLVIIPEESEAVATTEPTTPHRIVLDGAEYELIPVVTRA